MLFRLALEVENGLPRLEVLCERFLSHVERLVFPGGCFFASVAAELDTRPGPVRDRIAEVQSDWTKLIASAIREAKRRDELDPDTSVKQLTFEINAVLAQANTEFLLHRDRAAFNQARRAIHDRLQALAARPRRRRRT